MPRITVSLTDDELHALMAQAKADRRPVPWQAAKLIADGLGQSPPDPTVSAIAHAVPPIPSPRQTGARDPGPASAKEIGRQHARMTPLVIEDESGLPPPAIRGTAPGVTVDPKAAELFRITEETLAETAGR